MRRLVLDEMPLCVAVIRDDRFTVCGAVATTVDHIDGTDYTDDSGEGRSWLNPAMCRPMCRDCHAKRTSKQGNEAKK